jgi:MurNAc alpha-1-phosphate uridylyltransferase
MKAMILSAGRGERMRPLTDSLPKALLPVNGKPLIEYHLAALAAAGISDVVINLAWLGEQIRSVVGNGGRFGLHIDYSDEGAAALETGGGIVKALALLGTDPFWVINGDVLTDYPFTDTALSASDQGRLILVPNPAHNLHGDFGIAADRVVNEASQLYTYSGIGLFRPGLFAGEQEGTFPLAPVLRRVADQNALSAELYPGRWLDVGTPERLVQAEESADGG